MGYDIDVRKKEHSHNSELEFDGDYDDTWSQRYEIWKKRVYVTTFSSYMGAFRMLREQGYDWFDIIDATDCDGGVSGNGEIKPIKLMNLEKALITLNQMEKPNCLSSEGRDEFTYRKPILKKFMEEIVEYCHEHQLEEIWIEFG